MVATRPLPGVPVAMVVAQPLPGFRGVHLHHLRRRLVRLLLADRQGPGVSTVHSVVVAQWGRPLPLRLGLLGRPVLWGVGGYTG